MTEYEIDGERFSTQEEFYDELDRAMQLSAWGHNLDAFNDILRGGLGTPEEGFAIRWKNHSTSKLRLGYPELFANSGCDWSDAILSNHADVSRYLRDAEQEKDQTVFDWLVEIIRRHGCGGAEQHDGVELVLD